MLITVVSNVSNLLPENAELLRVIRSITRQIYHDFEPYWHLSARLRLSTAKNPDAQLDPVTGGAVIYLTTWKAWADIVLSQGRNPGPYCKGFHARIPPSQ